MIDNRHELFIYRMSAVDRKRPLDYVAVKNLVEVATQSESSIIAASEYYVSAESKVDDI